MGAMDTNDRNPREPEQTWCVRYERADGPIETKCFTHRSAAIRYGKWLQATDPSGRLTVSSQSGSTG